MLFLYQAKKKTLRISLVCNFHDVQRQSRASCRTDALTDHSPAGASCHVACRLSELPLYCKRCGAVYANLLLFLLLAAYHEMRTRKTPPEAKPASHRQAQRKQAGLQASVARQMLHRPSPTNSSQRQNFSSNSVCVCLNDCSRAPPPKRHGRLHWPLSRPYPIMKQLLRLLPIGNPHRPASRMFSLLVLGTLTVPSSNLNLEGVGLVPLIGVLPTSR